MTVTGPGRRDPGVVIGVDGGGTRTRIALADRTGIELKRDQHPATLVDAVAPDRSARLLVELVRRTAEDAGVPLPAAGLCAGLAGAGDSDVRRAVRETLAGAGLAARVEVITDGELALDAATDGGPGVVLVSGTGSVAYGRSEQGEIARCGGWGLVVGDEGSGYATGRAGLHAVLRTADGRGEPTELLPRLLAALGLDHPEQVPAWSARSDKAATAALAPIVVELAESGDAVAGRIVDDAAEDLALHVGTLLDRLGPWSRPVPVVFLGSLLQRPGLALRVEDRLAMLPWPILRRPPLSEPVAAALGRARSL